MILDLMSLFRLSSEFRGIFMTACLLNERRDETARLVYECGGYRM